MASPTLTPKGKGANVFEPLVGGMLLTAEALATSLTYAGSVLTPVSLVGQMFYQAHVTFIWAHDQPGRNDDESVS